MSLSEDQLRKSLASAPDDWPKRFKLFERLADRWAGQEMDMLLAASPNAPATEAEMRRVVDLANAHCPGYRGLKHVLGLFLETHLTSSWAHFIQAQAQFYSGEEEAALRHYQTSKSLNPSRVDPEMDRLLAARGVAAVSAAAARSVEKEPDPVPAMRKQITPVPPKESKPEEAEWILHPSSEPEAPGETRDPELDVDPGFAGDAKTEGSTVENKGHEPETAPKINEAEEAELDRKPVEESGTPENGEPPEKGSAANDGSADEKAEPAADEKSGKIEKRPAAEDDPDSPFHTEPLGEDGHPVGAAKKEDDSRERLSALSIALIAHVMILFIFAFWQVVKPRPDPPMFVSSSLTTGEEKKPNRLEIKRYQRPKMPSSSARMQVMTAPAISAVPMPEMTRSVATFDPIGNGDDFGPGMSFGGGGGGAVSFFGSKSTSKRVVFVVDVSASMGGSKDQLMRKELTKSIGALPPSVEYALIFFGGPAWYAGQRVGEASLEGQWVANVVQDGSRRYVWYEGWSEKERHDGSRTSALYHYSLGPQNLPRGPYQKATKTNLRKTIEQIEQTPLIFGTDWRWPLRMAMNMKPDTIFFMTDGAFGTGRGISKEEMIDGLLEHNRKTGNARINTICMMVLQARKELEKLARGSQGQFTLVKSDGTVVRGADLDKE